MPAFDPIRTYGMFRFRAARSVADIEHTDPSALALLPEARWRAFLKNWR
jgi:hypothetical protein